jgi:hypothetical protein
MRSQVSERVAIHVIRKFVDTVRDALNITVVALVHFPVKDIETPDGIRNHIQKRQNSSVQYSKSARYDKMLERTPHFVDERYQPQHPQRFQRPRKPAEASDEYQTGRYIDNNSNHHDEIQAIPDTFQIRIRSEQESIRDEFDEEFDEQSEAESRFSDLKPSATTSSMFNEKVPSIRRCCNPFHHNTA